MRTEKEMYDLILDIAKNDERIRAIYSMNAPDEMRALHEQFYRYLNDK